MGLSRKEFLRLSAGGLAAAASGGFFAFLDAPKGFAEDVLQSDRIRKIHSHIASNKARHIARVQEYLRQPSVSSWGLGIKECAELLMSYFQRLGSKEVELVKTEGNPGVWAYYDAGAPKTISFYIMYDTQPFDEKEWGSPPLAANIVKMAPFGDVIMARGAVNDKGADAMVFNALDSILEVEGKLRQPQRLLGPFLQNRRGRTDVTDLALDKDFGVRRLGDFDRALRLLHVLFKRQLRVIEENFVVASFRNFLHLLQRMCVICIEKNRMPEFVAQTADHRGRRASADKFPLAFRHPDQHREIQFARGIDDRPQRRQIGDIEMADGNVSLRSIGQSFPQ